MRNILYATLLVFMAAGCAKDEPYFKEINYYFNDNLEGWQSFFSDYPQGEEAFYELEYGLQKLPLPLDTSLKAVRISGNNHSDDLLTCMYVPVTGLIPNTYYDVSFIVQMASNVSSSSMGIGGSPNLSLGVGGLDTVPTNTVVDNYYRPNFEVRLQSHLSNDVMQVVGRLGVTDTTTVYTAKSFTNYNMPFRLKTNHEGTLYPMIGWDSGFEGRTTIYIKTIIVRVEALE